MSSQLGFAFGKSRAEQNLERFLEFDTRFPLVWELFERFGLLLLSRRPRGSARAIIERIRWECDVESVDDLGFKLNDHFAPLYARMFVVAHPEAAEFFRMRRLTSAERPAHRFEPLASELEGGPWYAEDFPGLIDALRAALNRRGFSP